MLNLLKIVGHIIAFGFLTVLTQVGGIIYLLTLLLKKRFRWGMVGSVLAFVSIYLLSTFVTLSVIAPMFGRVALPLSGNLKPLNFGTVILNRHYVTPRLKQEMVEIANKMNSKYDGTSTNYLDANFPFFDGFPLIPHLSHNDGSKLDLAFYYRIEGTASNSAPSFIGYGVYEEPRLGEPDYPTICREKGYWQYSLLSSIVPQKNKDKYSLDEERTRTLIELVAAHSRTQKIFIEPHLKERLRLNNLDKVRYHGCQAVRHDDHIHIQAYKN